MRPRLFGNPFLISLGLLTALGSIFGVTLLLGGSALHGEFIGGPYGVLIAPVFAAVGSLISLVVVAIPASALIRWLFEKRRWRSGLRWIVIPLTGPIFFLFLAPLFRLIGERDEFSAAACSFALGCVVSTYWLTYLTIDYFAQRLRPPELPQRETELGVAKETKSGAPPLN